MISTVGLVGFKHRKTGASSQARGRCATEPLADRHRKPRKFSPQCEDGHTNGGNPNVMTHSRHNIASNTSSV